MKKKTILKVFFSVLTVFLALTCTLASIKTKKVKADTITDLTNTTWLLNDRIDTNITASINFTSNNNNYTSFRSYYDFGMDWQYIVYNTFETYVNGWVNQVYRTIYITGGADVTSSTLINWLQNNGTQQTPTPTGTQITHKYWSPYGVIQMTDNQTIGDNEIQYTVLFNEQRRQYDETTQTGLIFKGMITTDNVPHSYIESINGSGINILYMGDNNNINNAMWLEFTYGDYMDTTLYDFMDLNGLWFDDAQPYIVGMNQGYAEGYDVGVAHGQADGVEYTNLITNILNGLGNLLNIQIFPNITIGLILGLPLLLGVFIIIIKILRG